MKVKVSPNYEEESTVEVELQDVPYGMKVKELVAFLKTVNQEAICLSKYDGMVYSIYTPKKVMLQKIWGKDKYTGPTFFVVYDEEAKLLEVVSGETALMFD